MKKLLKKLMISFGVFSLLFISGCKSEEEEPPKEPVEIRENSMYSPPKNPTDEMAAVYNELTDAINNQADGQTIATLAATNFAYDFFTLYNKEGVADIGGMEFIPSSMQEEFREYASAWFYQNYDIIVNMYDKDTLPYVAMHEVIETVPEQVTFKDVTYDAYRVKLVLKYRESDIDPTILKTDVELIMISADGVYVVKELL